MSRAKKNVDLGALSTKLGAARDRELHARTVLKGAALDYAQAVTDANAPGRDERLEVTTAALLKAAGTHTNARHARKRCEKHLRDAGGAA